MAPPSPARTERSKASYQRSRSRSAHSGHNAQHSQLCKVSSPQHLEDNSNYYGEEEPRNEREITSMEGSEVSEKEGKSGDEDTQPLGESGAGTTVNERDVEAPLEKTESSKSVHDPNLVARLQS